MRKRILSLLLALTLCVGLAVPALAAEPTLKIIPSITVNFPGTKDLTATLTNVYDMTGGVQDLTYFYFTSEGTVQFDQDIPIGSGYNGDGSSDVEVTLKAGTVYKVSDLVVAGTSQIQRLDEKVVSIQEARTARDNAPVSESGSLLLELWPVVFMIDEDESYEGSNVTNLETLEHQAEFQASEAFQNSETVTSQWYKESFISYWEISSTPAAPSAWATEQVSAAIAAGIVPEALQSKYTAAATRAEFCALAVALYETATGKEITGRSTFSDTTDVNVQKMASLGVVAGVGDNKFSPDTSLTREQAAAMLSRLASVMNKPMPEQAPTFADNGKIGSWAYDAVGHVQAAGIMSGVGNNQFSPSTAYTREQSIVTMLRMFDYVK